MITSATAVQLADQVRQAGCLRITAGELGLRFGVHRLTAASREALAAELASAGITCSPPIRHAVRNEPVALTVSAPSRGQDSTSVAQRGGKRKRTRVLAALGVLALLLVIVGAATDGSDQGKRSPTPAPSSPAPSREAARVSPVKAARQQAEDIASTGRYPAAVAFLRAHGDDTYADNLARRGARRLLRQARAAFDDTDYERARTYARRANALWPSHSARSAMARAEAEIRAERAASGPPPPTPSSPDSPSGSDGSNSNDSGSGTSGDSPSAGSGATCSSGTPYPTPEHHIDRDGDGCYGEK